MQSTQDRGSEFKKKELRSGPVLLKSFVPKTDVEYVKIGDYKKIREEINPQSHYQADLDFSQVIKEQIKPAAGALINRSEFVEEEKLKAIIKFFFDHSHINPKNFTRARKLFLNYFISPESFSHRLVLLAQAFDRYTSPNSRFGKILLSKIPSKEDTRTVKICIQRFLPIHSRKNPSDRVEQYISFDFIKRKEAKRGFQVFNQVKTVKESYSELLRERKNAPNPSLDSLNFDVQVWKSTHNGKILASNYQKVLDCAERNSHNFGAFIEEINKKSLSNILLPNPIKEAKIKGNGKSVVVARLINQHSQTIQVQVSKTISALRISL